MIAHLLALGRPEAAIAILAAATPFVAGCGCDGARGLEVPTDRVTVRIGAHDRSWEASYLLPAGDGGATRVPTGRDVHVPLGALVSLSLSSRDFICEFALPGFGVRDFAAPGLPYEVTLRPERAGVFELRGDELCGLPHTDRTRGRIVVEDPARFRAFVRERAFEQRRGGRR